MLLLVAVVHSELVVATGYPFGERPPEPVLIACPGCGQFYVAGRAPDEEPFDLEQLAGACPAHRHSFKV